jgi:hypothetical protein
MPLWCPGFSVLPALRVRLLLSLGQMARARMDRAEVFESVISGIVVLVIDLA